MKYSYKIFEYTFKCDCSVSFTLEGKTRPNAFCPECQEKVKLISEKLLRVEHKEG